MKSLISQYHSFALIRFGRVLIMVLMVAVTAATYSVPANAEAPATNATQAYCTENVPPKAKAACQSNKNIDHMRNAASYHCIKQTNNKKERCITSQTTKYINSAKKGANSPEDFTNKLNVILAKDTRATGGSVSVASPDSKVGLSDGNGGLFGPNTADNQCGGGKNAIQTSIDFGCTGKGNAMLDLTFAIIRFLSNGAGLVIIGSLIWGGIQYSGSRGDPQATALAVNRIRSTLFALLLFLFAYAILNYLMPGRFLR